MLAKSSESPRVSKRDEKLDTLLRAIETYDRSDVMSTGVLFKCFFFHECQARGDLMEE